MRHMVELEDDTIRSIILAELTEALNNLVNDWSRIYEGKLHVFSHDKEQDLHQVSELISSMKKVIKYYGGKIKSD